MQTKNEVQQILANVLGQSIDVEIATRDVSPEWDSIATLSILAEIEEKFEIQLTDEEIQQINNLDEIVKIISSNLGARN